MCRSPLCRTVHEGGLCHIVSRCLLVEGDGSVVDELYDVVVGCHHVNDHTCTDVVVVVSPLDGDVYVPVVYQRGDVLAQHRHEVVESADVPVRRSEEWHLDALWRLQGCEADGAVVSDVAVAEAGHAQQAPGAAGPHGAVVHYGVMHAAGGNHPSVLGQVDVHDHHAVVDTLHVVAHGTDGPQPRRFRAVAVEAYLALVDHRRVVTGQHAERVDGELRGRVVIEVDVYESLVDQAALLAHGRDAVDTQI